MQSPTTERKNEYRINFSSLGIFFIRIIAVRFNNAKNMNETKYIRLSILFIQNIVEPKIGIRIPPKKPIKEIRNIIVFFKICFSSIYFFTFFFGLLTFLRGYLWLKQNYFYCLNVNFKGKNKGLNSDCYTQMRDVGDGKFHHHMNILSIDILWII